MMAEPVTLASLALLPIWVGWRLETRGGRPAKVPFDPMTGENAATDNPAT